MVVMVVVVGIGGFHGEVVAAEAEEERRFDF